MPGPTGHRPSLSIYDDVGEPITAAEALERRRRMEADRRFYRPRPWYDRYADQRRIQQPEIQSETVWWDEETWANTTVTVVPPPSARTATRAATTATSATTRPSTARHWSDGYQITAQALEEMRRQMMAETPQRTDFYTQQQEFIRALRPVQLTTADNLEYTVQVNRRSMYNASDLETQAEYEAPEGSFLRAIVGIEVEDNNVRYAETSGRISPAHVARVLMRYYNNRNRVLTHLFARPSKCFPSILHPDPERCTGTGRTTHLINANSYTGGTRGSPEGSHGYGIAFLYTKDGWCVRSREGWTLLTNDTL